MAEDSRSPAASVVGRGSRISSTPRRTVRIQACERCHARKVKCSGGTPCANCVDAGHGVLCLYKDKSRHIKVTRRFLDNVLAENEKLKETTTSNMVARQVENEDPSEVAADLISVDEAVSNPVMNERAWFVVSDSSRLPIYIAEAACPAFATRFRQSLSPTGTLIAHFPRVHYVGDEYLSPLPDSQISWPSKVDAQLFVKVAIARVNRGYHVLLYGSTIAKLNQAYMREEPLRIEEKCKLFALFALGQVYSSSAGHGSIDEFPGLLYFRYACQMLQVLPERASLEHIEALVLLSFYSHNINRRNSAYRKIGSAMRMAVSLGLHHNLPTSITIEPLLQQHRICLWWTIYVCDRMWASKLGQPLGIQDNDISVDLPSIQDVSENEKGELPDSGFVLASIELARIAGNIINTIYCRNKPPPFVQSVQKILRSLKKWVATLPANVRLGTHGGTTARHITALHLSFNQCLILATRPILLYVFEKSQSLLEDERNNPARELDMIISTLAEACIHAARHSNELLTQIWIEGTLTTLGYFDAQYLFSSAMVLAISGVLDDKNNDSERMDSASQLLQSMADSGNLSAIEFHGHLSQIKTACSAYRSKRKGQNENSLVESLGTLSDATGNINNNNNLSTELTTEMVLGQTPMQDFLTQPDVTFDLPTSGFLDDNYLFFDWNTQF